MLDHKVISSRLKKLEKCVQKLRTVATVDKKKFLKDEDLQDKAERNLHIAIECCLDIGNHIISALGFRTPKDYEDIFQILGEEKIIPREFSQSLRGIGGFRNILVHDYLDVDLSKVYDHLQKLKDFNRFAQYISEFAQKEI